MKEGEKLSSRKIVSENIVVTVSGADKKTILENENNKNEANKGIGLRP